MQIINKRYFNIKNLLCKYIIFYINIFCCYKIFFRPGINFSIYVSKNERINTNSTITTIIIIPPCVYGLNPPNLIPYLKNARCVRYMPKESLSTNRINLFDLFILIFLSIPKIPILVQKHF